MTLASKIVNKVNIYFLLFVCLVFTIPFILPNTYTLESEDFVLVEASALDKSTSPDLWLNSGAYFYVLGEGSAHTQFGPLPENSYWHQAYINHNSGSTANGFYPQNIFRLITRTYWRNFTQELGFNIVTTNNTDTEYQNESNGVLLFMRYLDSNNLYYAGLRVDGAFVIKRKREGNYETLAYRKYFPGEYDASLKNSLIPSDKWHYIKTSIKNNSVGSPQITLYYKESLSDPWQEVLYVVDTSPQAITSEASAGIRTDFMDVSFRDYKLKEFFEI